MDKPTGNGPSVTSPWYVIYRHPSNGMHIEYFRAANGSDELSLFTQVKGLALIYTDLKVCARTAVAAGDDTAIRVLVGERDAREFGHAAS